MWARQLSRYSDWLRGGRSGDRIPVGARFSAPVQTGPGAHPASCTMSTGSFRWVNSGRGVTLTPHPLLVPLVLKEQSYTSTPPMGRTACTEPQQSYTSTPLMGRTACTEPQCLYKGDLYLCTYHRWQYGVCALHAGIRKATNAHTCCVTRIAFPLQQWLHESPSMLCYMYSDCLA